MTIIGPVSYLTVTQNMTVTQISLVTIMQNTSLPALHTTISPSTSSDSTSPTAPANNSSTVGSMFRRVYVSDPTSSPPVAPAASLSAACLNAGNVLTNGDFETVAGNSSSGGGGGGATNSSAPPPVVGWTSTSGDPASAYFADISATDQDAQFTPNGTRLARFTLGGSAGNVVAYQPVTLCPNTLYYLSLDIVQKSQTGACRVDVGVGGQTLTLPGGQPSGRYIMMYTSGPTARADSVYFVLNMTCPAVGDVPGGTWAVDVDEVRMQYGSG